VRAQGSRWWLLGGGLIVAGVLAAALAVVRRRGELPVYTIAAARLLAGEEIYRTTDAKPFSYPPFFALPALPLLGLPDQFRALTWYFVSLVALAEGVALVLRQLRPVLPAWGAGGRPSRLLFLGLLGALTAELLMAPIQYASHDSLLFLVLMVGVSAWAGGAPVRAGVFLGLGAAAKATPLVFLAVFLWQRELGAALALAVTAAAATLVPDGIFPRADGQLWAAVWYRTFVAPLNVGQPAEVEGVWRAGNHLNQSLAATVYRLLTPVPGHIEKAPDVSLLHPGPVTAEVVMLLGQLAVLAALAWVTRRGPDLGVTPAERAFRRLGEAGAACAVMLLLSPMSGRQHFAVLLLPAAVCLADFLYRRRAPLVGGLLGMMLLLGTVADKDFVGRAVGNRLLAYGSLTGYALAALLGTAWVLADRRRTMRRSGTHPHRAARQGGPHAGS